MCYRDRLLAHARKLLISCSRNPCFPPAAKVVTRYKIQHTIKKERQMTYLRPVDRFFRFLDNPGFLVRLRPHLSEDVDGIETLAEAVEGIN